MFRKSFKPAKCKKALQLAIMRIKFANQNREAKLTQLKKEVSALLHNFQHQTATIQIGQSTFGKAAYVEPSEVHTSPVHGDDGPANSCATSQLEPKHDASTHSYEQNASGAARNGSGNHTTTPGMANVEITSSGDGGQEMNFEDSYSENRSAFPVGGIWTWNPRTHKRQLVLMNLTFKIRKVKQKRNQAHWPQFATLIPMIVILRMDFINGIQLVLPVLFVEYLRGCKLLQILVQF